MSDDRLPLPTADSPPAERCETCRFWRPLVLAQPLHGRWNGYADFEEKHGQPAGTCNRFPPAVRLDVPKGKDLAAGNFPGVNFDDWCGEWQAKVPVLAARPEWAEWVRRLPFRLRTAFRRHEINSFDALLSDAADHRYPHSRKVDPLMWKNVGRGALADLCEALKELGVTPPAHWSD